MTKKKQFMKRMLPLFMAVMMVFTGIPVDFINSVTGSEIDSITTVYAANDYGLADNIQDGTILHCFDWKYKDIEAELPNIAEAGFTSVQTSPAQRDDTNGVWYMLYQPQNFSITTNALGSKQDLKDLCKEADKYGIKVIVDVVANHTRGDGTSNDDYINSSTHSDYFRTGNLDSGSVNWENRSQVITCNIGMRDLVSEDENVQQIVKNYIQELKDVGVDGIRWDAAKHIGLPSEGCDFWKTVTSLGLWNYGEILTGPDDRSSGNEALMKEYTDYMSVTDNVYGSTLLGNMRDGKVTTENGRWINKNAGITADKLVYWAESHDTYANDRNDGGWTKDIDQAVVDRAYALAASRDGATALYFSRPQAKEKTEIMAGVKGSTHFTAPQVAEVNKFHNAMIGQKEYYTADTSQNVAAVCREEGAVVVKASGGSGTVSISNGGSTTAPGTYIDHVSGNTWTVTSTTISGTIGDTGIAVLYNDNTTKTPAPTISKEGGNFNTDTLELTIGLRNASSGTYQIGNATPVAYSASTTITIGANMAYGESVTVKLTASDGNQTNEKSYTFTKVEKAANVAYLSLPSGWSAPIYCYTYDSATEKMSNATWPGVEMEYDSATGYYKYEIPETIEKPRVIFSTDVAANRTPADQEKGYLFEEDGSWLYKDGQWSQYTSPVSKGSVTIKYVDETGKEIADAVQLTGTVGTSYTTTAKTITGYTLKTTPSNASGAYTAEAITVTYVYEAETDNTPKVTASLASGATFETETQKITLTLSNATSGTYQIDNGPVKTFTGSKEIVLGQGKVADSVVTVKATADSKEYTFTYHKKFSKTVDESVSATTATAEKAGSTLAKYYATNGIGSGKNATITIDGSFDDWSEDMLIAQGAAWDVANHYKGGHENCVLDTYALYGAWDDNNLYIGCQMVNTTDTWANSGDGPLSDGGRVLDVPLILALSIDENSTSMTNKNTDGGAIWGQKMGLKFTTHVDRLFYMSGKPGLGQPAMFKAVDAAGNTDYEEGCVGFTAGGIEYKMAQGNISSKIMGLNSSNDTSDIFNDAADWVDYKTFVGEKGVHDTSYDSFYEMKIPLSTLGITKSYIESNGIGAMFIATRGESALDCIPYDASMLDNATGDYSNDNSTSAEKEDVDNITVNLARIGKTGATPTTNLELNFGADRSSPQLIATDLTLKGIAQGGTAPYTYKFYVNNQLVDTKSGSGETSTTWKPVSGETYMIQCVVEDSNGNSVISAKKYVIEGETQCTHTNTTKTGAKSATCVETGYTGDVVCADCGIVLQKGEEISLTEHTWDNGTKQEDGSTLYTCTVCKKTKTVENQTITIPESAVVIETDNYVYDGKAKKPIVTVTVNGQTLIEDIHYTVNYLNNVNAGNQDSAKKPAVEVTGKGNYSGTVTKYFEIEKAEIPDNAPTTEMNVAKSVEKVSDIGLKTGWTWLEADKEKELVIGEEVKATAEYTLEDKDNYKKTSVEITITKSDCDHNNTVQQNVKAVTCTEDGYTGDVYCNDCQKVIEKGTTVYAKGHSWNDGVITKQPTVTENGIKIFTCETCGETKEVEISKTGECTHSDKVRRDIVKASCTVSGSTGALYCAYCNELLEKAKEVKALGHTFNNGEITKQPTATESGNKKYICKVCGYVKNETIAPTGNGNNNNSNTESEKNPVITVSNNVNKGDYVVDPKTQVTYKITGISSKAKTVEYVSTNANAEKIVIPDTVTINGVVYKVTTISSNAFQNNSVVKQVIIGKNITTIGQKAFYKCKKLTSITIPSKVKSIGQKAFYGCSSLKKITIKTTQLTSKKVGKQAFKGISAKATIKVPKKKLNAYKKLLKAKGVGKKVTIKK